MFNQLKDAVNSVLKMFGDLPTPKKVALAAVAFIMVVGILVTAYLSTGTEYTVLYANLDKDDALEITRKLKEKNIMYQLEADGTAITVPEMDVHQLRLELAGEGLPSGGAVGYEIFDESTFGMTEFAQNINYRRALQGELQRTINSMGNIKSSRVHIAIPRRTLFEDEENTSKASVVLKMSGGTRKPGQDQIDSIIHLVSSSVEGLDPTKVTIVDTRGNLLSSPEDESELGRMSVKQMEYRKMYESDVEKRLRTMLERAVGIGRVVVRVNASMDFSQVQRTEEIYDPNSQVARSEQRMEEESTGASMPSGVAGVSSNLPGVEKNEATFSKPASSSKVNETINYEINKTVQTVVEPTAEVKKLSVAVLVDGKYTGNEGAEGGRQWQALTQEETQRLENLVRSAIGFNPDRQDSVTIESMQFDVPPVSTSMEESGVMTNADFIMNIVKLLGFGTLAAVVFFMVIRPLLGYMGGASAEVEELRTFPKTVEDLEAELSKMSDSPEGKVDHRERVSQLVMDNPEQAANLVRAWLRTRS